MKEHVSHYLIVTFPPLSFPNFPQNSNGTNNVFNQLPNHTTSEYERDSNVTYVMACIYPRSALS